jgi:hypothetical protein
MRGRLRLSPLPIELATVTESSSSLATSMAHFNQIVPRCFAFVKLASPFPSPFTIGFSIRQHFISCPLK